VLTTNECAGCSWLAGGHKRLASGQTDDAARIFAFCGCLARAMTCRAARRRRLACMSWSLLIEAEPLEEVLALATWTPHFALAPWPEYDFPERTTRAGFRPILFGALQHSFDRRRAAAATFAGASNASRAGSQPEECELNSSFMNDNKIRHKIY